jgi:hypothetical protein
MAKRMTSTGKWDKAWFRKLSPRHKALWQFLCDRCDHAGMWEIDMDSASHFINDVEPITFKDIEVFGNRVERFRGDKLWIIDFCQFQYEKLSEKCPAHKPVFKLLKKYSLLDRVLARLSDSLQEIEKEIEKEMVTETETPPPAKVALPTPKETEFKYHYREDADVYESPEQAFNEVKDDELAVERIVRLARNAGYLTYTDVQVMKAVRHFFIMEGAKDDFTRRPRDEVKNHLVNWINRYAKKIADYGSN